MNIRCWRLRSALTAYVDDEAALDVRQHVEAHLLRCDTCRHRVSREQAVRQRLRRWAAEMRKSGAPLPWSRGAKPMPQQRIGSVLRLSIAPAATILLALVLWRGWPAGASVPFTAHGQITDTRCAAGHTHTGPALQNMNGADCVRRCVETGAEYVFVSQGVVYPIRNQDFVDLTHLAGQEVQLEGEVQRNRLTVSHVRPLAARGSVDDRSPKQPAASTRG